jgi:hypothetical protein
MFESELFQKVYNQLSVELQSSFNGWCQVAQQVERGEDVVRNIKAEQYLDEGCFLDFLNFLTQFFDEQPNNNKNVVQAYNSACEKLSKRDGVDLLCRGRVSDVPNKSCPSTVTTSAHLYRFMIKQSRLKNIISHAYDNTGSRKHEVEQDWDKFESHLKAQDEDYKQILRCCALPKIRTAFAYHHPDPEQSEIDPLAEKNIDECLNLLGLAEEWGYKRGQDSNSDESSWKIIYASQTLECYIPTIADSFRGGWNPYFQPTQDSGDRVYGWTRPISSSWGERGQPETVHWGWDWRSEDDPGGFIAIEFPE